MPTITKTPAIAGILVGAIGLEPTTPTMSTRYHAMRLLAYRLFVALTVALNHPQATFPPPLPLRDLTWKRRGPVESERGDPTPQQSGSHFTASTNS